MRFRPSPEADAAIAAYGEHDPDAVERALAYVTLFLAAVTPLVAERAGVGGRVEAQRRIDRALAYARTRSTTVHG
jgi:hypothetical protein